MRTVGMGAIPKDAALKQEIADLGSRECSTGNRRSQIWKSRKVPKDQGRRSGSVESREGGSSMSYIT